MARDPDALKIRKWAGDKDANSTDRIDPDHSSLTPSLVRGDGWPASFSQAGGNNPRRAVFNQLFCEITGMLVELNDHGGLLDYDQTQDYVHPAFVVGSDNRPYMTKRTNGPASSNVGAPGTSGNGALNWTPLFGDFSTQSLTYASSLTWDVQYTPNAEVTLDGNVTDLTLSNILDGDVCCLLIKQDATGGRTFAFPSAWKWEDGLAKSIATGSNDETILTVRKIGNSIYVAPLLKDLS